jgi:hypothetical protein
MSTLERYKTALELIGYREMCHDSEAEEMRQLARNAVGMNNPIPSRTRPFTDPIEADHGH